MRSPCIRRIWVSEERVCKGQERSAPGEHEVGLGGRAVARGVCEVRREQLLGLPAAAGGAPVERGAVGDEEHQLQHEDDAHEPREGDEGHEQPGVGAVAQQRRREAGEPRHLPGQHAGGEGAPGDDGGVEQADLGEDEPHVEVHKVVGAAAVAGEGAVVVHEVDAHLARLAVAGVQGFVRCTHTT